MAGAFEKTGWHVHDYCLIQNHQNPRVGAIEQVQKLDCSIAQMAENRDPGEMKTGKELKKNELNYWLTP